jgi:hypothetical protein
LEFSSGEGRPTEGRKGPSHLELSGLVNHDLASRQTAKEVAEKTANALVCCKTTHRMPMEL